MGPAAQRWANAASLRSLPMFCPAVTSSCPAWWVPIPSSDVVLGATRRMSSSSARSSRRISSSRAATRRARLRSANLAAWRGSASRSESGRNFPHRRAWPTRVFRGRDSRSSAGAVTSRSPSWHRAAERAFTAPSRATRSWRMDSIAPAVSLGTTTISPARTFRAAASASTGSDLPLRLRMCLWGWFTSSTRILSARKPTRQTSAVRRGRLDSQSLDCTESLEPRVQCPVAGERCGELRIPEQLPTVVQGDGVMGSRVTVHAADDTSSLLRHTCLPSSYRRPWPRWADKTATGLAWCRFLSGHILRPGRTS